MKANTRHDPSAGIPIQLLRWIKEQQEKEVEHQSAMAKRNAEDDLMYAKMIVDLLKKVDQRSSSGKKQAILLMNFARWKAEGKNFTPSQRSVVAGMMLAATPIKAG